MKKFYPILFSILFICPIVIMIVAVIHAKKQGVTYKMADPAGLKRKWNAETFNTIEDTTAFKNELNARMSEVLSNVTLLTKEQNDNLKQSIHLFLLAYHTGNYDDYERFRFPISEGHFDTNRAAEFLAKIKTIPQFCADLNTNDMRAVVKKIWETYGVMGRVYCISCWKDVAVSSIKLAQIAPVSDKKIPNIAQSILDNENIGGSVTIHPFFYFSPSEADILRNNKTVIVAIVTAIVKEDGGISYPVYIQYYWSDQNHSWLPRDIALGYWNEKQLFLF